MQKPRNATGNAVIAMATLTWSQGCSEARFHCEITVTF